MTTAEPGRALLGGGGCKCYHLQDTGGYMAEGIG